MKQRRDSTSMMTYSDITVKDYCVHPAWDAIQVGALILILTTRNVSPAGIFPLKICTMGGPPWEEPKGHHHHPPPYFSSLKAKAVTGKEGRGQSPSLCGSLQNCPGNIKSRTLLKHLTTPSGGGLS